eukprot:4817170-Lingulodinium_polyedra.AAC.1
MPKPEHDGLLTNTLPAQMVRQTRMPRSGSNADLPAGDAPPTFRPRSGWPRINNTKGYTGQRNNQTTKRRTN